MATPNISVYLNSTNNSMGANASIRTQKEHYDNLAENYEQKGMKREAEVFFNVAEELAILQKQILGTLQKRKTLRNK